ncbi:serine hydrolase [Lentzea sp. NBRC 105346]|uniref:serine hydrolase domain-containing protein n=1 Tax=Lentzea sp. NBRC 105346 TaxID=3032205 RepID=UPI00249FB95E|nr:serine hydrolase domain-containing protein [Lentzea sp. NBRC 105346]GLZ30785.1 serine hydrolase [Lentzea sp. NBRC 105346]
MTAVLSEGVVSGATDELFSVGSITKLFTATLVQRLVLDGMLDLDAPVRTYLPEFEVPFTTRHLMTHSAGFEGDVYVDCDLTRLPQITPPGSVHSYSQTGWQVAGLLVESLRGKPLPVLIDDLGLPGIDAWEARGHYGLRASTRGLLEFARLHMEDPALAVMRDVHAPVPDRYLGGAWGLGWRILAPGVAGHEGNSPGEHAMLVVTPSFAVALRGEPAKVHASLRSLLPEIPRFPGPPATPIPVDPHRAVGVYASMSLREEVLVRDGEVWLHVEPLRPDVAELIPEQTVRAVQLLPDHLVAVEPVRGLHHVHVLLGDDGTGRATMLHNSRAQPRVA